MSRRSDVSNKFIGGSKDGVCHCECRAQKAIRVSVLSLLVQIMVLVVLSLLAVVFIYNTVSASSDDVSIAWLDRFFGITLEISKIS